MQILFPEPKLAKLRTNARQQDRPVSELIRNAVEFWLSRYSAELPSQIAEPAPVYRCGQMLSSSGSLRSIAHAEREDMYEKS